MRSARECRPLSFLVQALKIFIPNFAARDEANKANS